MTTQTLSPKRITRNTEVRSLDELHRATRKAVIYQFASPLMAGHTFRAQYLGVNNGEATFAEFGNNDMTIYVHLVDERDMRFDEHGHVVFQAVNKTIGLTHDVDGREFEGHYQDLREAGL
jgi:hypothetical protein